jgi:hypothetical protein
MSTDRHDAFLQCFYLPMPKYANKANICNALSLAPFQPDIVTTVVVVVVVVVVAEGFVC